MTADRGIQVPGAATAALALLLAWGPAQPGEAWGFTAHRMVNRKAIRTLPPPLRSLFDANADYVAEHSIDPDLWRAAGRPGEEPNHYLDVDSFGPCRRETIPCSEADHLARHAADAAAHGRLPWRVAELYKELVAAFRSKDPAQVLERAAALGHYVADAHVPLHAATNHDGQLTGQNGIHARWEADMVERFERQIEPLVSPPAARPVADPLSLALDVLVASCAAAPEVLASDRASAGPRDLAETPEDDRYGDAYYSKLYEREAGRLRSRLTEAAAAVGSLWLTAWMEAGRPTLPPFRFPYVRKQSRAILVSVDGAGALVIDDAVARAVMPHLARLRVQGATARGVVTSRPAKTAAAHAALFTGAWPDRSGITGNEIPVPGGSVLDAESGHASTYLRAEPLWATAARQGLDVSVATATQVFPFDPYLGERRFGGDFGRWLTLLDGYRRCDEKDAVYGANDLSIQPTSVAPDGPRHVGEARSVTLEVAGARIEGLLYDDPDDPVTGFDTLFLSSPGEPKRGVRLKAKSLQGADASAFAGFRFRSRSGDAGVYFRLFALSPDGADIVLYRSHVHSMLSNKPRVASAALEAIGGFIGNGGDHLYERGALGPPLWEGGDGTAERRYLETLGLLTRQMSGLADFAADHTRWDVLVAYLPLPDEPLHLWLGYLDPSLPGHDPALAARLRPFLDASLALVDGFVGHLAGRLQPDTLLAVAADHGVEGTSGIIRPNVALARAGLLALDANGRVDLARTQAICFPWSPWQILVNGVARRGGIVPPADEDRVRSQAAAVLRALRDPSTGAAVVADVVEPRAPGSDPENAGPGDLYLTVAPGYTLAGEWAGEPVEAAPPRGEHFQHPEHPAMQAIFALAGPGVAAGADLGTIRIIDIAPTLCALLGIDPPAHSSGRVLEKALSRSPTAVVRGGP